jgi:hypothetical protein
MPNSFPTATPARSELAEATERVHRLQHDPRGPRRRASHPGDTRPTTTALRGPLTQRDVALLRVIDLHRAA